MASDDHPWYVQVASGLFLSLTAMMWMIGLYIVYQCLPQHLFVMFSIICAGCAYLKFNAET